jgi:hypothetical protein
MVFATIGNYNPNLGMFNATQGIENLLGFQYQNYCHLTTINMTMYIGLAILKTKI